VRGQGTATAGGTPLERHTRSIGSPPCPTDPSRNPLSPRRSVAAPTSSVTYLEEPIWSCACRRESPGLLGVGRGEDGAATRVWADFGIRVRRCLRKLVRHLCQVGPEGGMHGVHEVHVGVGDHEGGARLSPGRHSPQEGQPDSVGSKLP
jgi:hypothetical protein